MLHRAAQNTHIIRPGKNSINKGGKRLGRVCEFGVMAGALDVPLIVAVSLSDAYQAAWILEPGAKISTQEPTWVRRGEQSSERLDARCAPRGRTRA